MRLLALLFTAASVSAWSQSLNLPRFDQKPLHFGFFLGISRLDFAVQQNPNWPEGIYHVVPQSAPGYLVGIISDLRLGSAMNLRFNPTYLAGERTLLIDGIDRSTGLRDWYTRRVVKIPVPRGCLRVEVRGACRAGPVRGFQSFSRQRQP